MRKTCLAIILAVLMTVPAAAFAQEALLEVLRSDVRAEKVALITEMMMFTDEQAEVFWPIYREMANDGSKLTDKRIALIKEYAENYDEMTDEVATDLIKKAFTLREKRLGLEKKYYKKFSKALDPITAAKFQQINHEINMMIDIQISAGLPFIE
jgi:hypothetical protein